jgi:hypothetical protein
MSRVLGLSCILILASHRDAATIECADVSSATTSCVMGAAHASFFCYVLHLPTPIHSRYQESS